jgi:hypothetical protein
MPVIRKQKWGLFVTDILFLLEDIYLTEEEVL